MREEKNSIIEKKYKLIDKILNSIANKFESNKNCFQSLIKDENLVGFIFHSEEEKEVHIAFDKKMNNSWHDYTISVNFFLAEHEQVTIEKLLVNSQLYIKLSKIFEEIYNPVFLSKAKRDVEILSKFLK